MNINRTISGWHNIFSVMSQYNKINIHHNYAHNRMCSVEYDIYKISPLDQVPLIVSIRTPDTILELEMFVDGKVTPTEAARYQVTSVIRNRHFPINDNYRIARTEVMYDRDYYGYYIFNTIFTVFGAQLHNAITREQLSRKITTILLRVIDEDIEKNVAIVQNDSFRFSVSRKDIEILDEKISVMRWARYILRQYEEEIQNRDKHYVLLERKGD